MITAGEVLKNKRESLGKDLNTVSVDTKIQKRFLEYIENNQYEKFDSEVFVSGFIKIYSKYLGLDVEKLLAIYRRSNLKNGKREEEKKNVIQRKNSFKIGITPQIFAIVLLVVFFLSVVGYIGYQIFKFQTPPQLTIVEPLDEHRTEENFVIVKGNTESTSSVTINGEPVETDSLGYFEKEIELKEGVNTISITSKKNSNNQLETTKTLKVLYVVQADDEITEQEEATNEYKVELKISNAASWIKLDIDGVNKVSQILDPNTQQEFTLERELTLVTGKVQSTQLLINGEEIKISSSQNTGVGQITCKIQNTGLECI
ncbi:hypothetical protein CVU76_00385 [Candidatus Dojkabacteria bacterium HGW-Dojkabacteria-1]|uniref:Cytoskeleton protein RodZ-like C-terminal domain-containing protein n=1 Tax=Candidatus Dojkabacteria bacterium HGW-Dojkabacteria-1 TaxID=2013761 RepID=A0A2N2F2W9_9BACT|nr:MAG: hypothetical protein CVU76_00385 [Candidatus Dojkabacteria bacterium HGW-Dojkabacteria-1]